MKKSNSDCVPELLFLRVSRIPAPWEAEADAKRMGYKCKRYAKWSVVHVQDDSAQVLSQIGNELLDAGEFPLEHYGHFARVWERVQRWTVDKESLSLPAPLLPSYENADRILRLGSQRQQYARQFVSESLGPSAQSLSALSAWNMLKQCVATQLLVSSRPLRAILGELQLPTSVESAENQGLSLRSAVAELYRAIGFEVQFTGTTELIDLLLGELGLPVDGDTADVEVGGSPAEFRQCMPSVLIESTERNDSRFLEVAVVKGSIVLKFNTRHAAFSGSAELKATLSQPMLWHTFGEACRTQLGMLDEVQSLLDSWGVHLAAASRRVQP